MVNTPTNTPAKTDEKGTQAPVSDVGKESVLKEAEKRRREFEGRYPNMTKEEILAEIKRKSPDAFKDKSDEEIMTILNDGVKDKGTKGATSLQQKDLYEWIKEQDRKQKDTQEKIKEASIKQEDIKRLKEDLKKDEEKPTTDKKKTEETKETKKIETKSTETKSSDKKPENKSRWTENDEANRPGSKPATEKEPEEKKISVPQGGEKEEKAPKEKKAKTPGHFREKTGRALARPFSTSRKLIKSAGKTIRTPIGLLSYLSADIGIKDKSKRTGRKDRWAGYGKIRKGKEKK